MDSAEIKIDLFKKLDGLNSNHLEEAYGLLLNFINGDSDINEWKNLPDEQKEAIELGLKQLDNGEGKDHEQVLANLKNKYL